MYKIKIRGGKKGHKKHPRIGKLIWCFCCSQYKDINEFYRSRTRSGSYDNICKSCKGGYQREHQRKYYLEHREELLPQHRISARKSNFNKSLSQVK